MTLRKLWLTRPPEDGAGLAEELARHGIESIVAPVMRITRMAYALPRELPAALLITSRNAAAALGDVPTVWRNLPMYCVGQSTADYARDMGFTNVIPGPSDALALLPRLTSEVVPGSTIVYFAGEELRVDIPTLLQVRGYVVTKLTVYRAVAESALAEDILEEIAAECVGGVVFFSPRSAVITNHLLSQAGHAEAARAIDAYCLSLNVAKEAGALAWKRLHTCPIPTRRAMCDLIISQSPRMGSA